MNIRKRIATLAAVAGLAILSLTAPAQAATAAHQPTVAAVSLSGNGPDNTRCC